MRLVIPSVPVTSLRFLSCAWLACGLASCGPRSVNRAPADVAEPESTAIIEPDKSAALASWPARPAGLPEEAAALVDRLATDFPQSVDALYVRGQILELFDQSNAAIACWEECLSLDPSYAHALEQIGLVALKRGEFAQAIEPLRQACNANSDLPYANLELGKALSNLGRYDEALVALERQATLQPGFAEGWFQLGQIHFHRGEFKRAVTCYESALNLNADYPQAWFGLAQACDRLDDGRRAGECRERFVKLTEERTASDRNRRRAASTPNDVKIVAQANAVAADIYAANGRLDQAHGYWRRAAELDRENIKCRLDLARALARDGHTEEAIAFVQQLKELQPKNVEHRLLAAMLYLQLQQWEQAEGELTVALEVAPDHPRALAALASYYLKRGQRLQDALRLAQRLVQADPTAENYFLLSSAFLANNDSGNGKAAIREAIRLEPGNPNYARTAAALGAQ